MAYPYHSQRYHWNQDRPHYTLQDVAAPQIYHYNYSTNDTTHQHSAWSADNAQPSYRASANASLTVGFVDSSSQRTILTPPPHYSPSAAPHYKNDYLHRSPSLSPDYSSWGDVLDDSSESSRHPSAPLGPSTPHVSSTPFIPSSPLLSSASVKEEPDDGASRFIMELSAPQVQSTFLSQSLAPPTEVPLRATQAPPEMRSMMGVFRLNPFAMHTGEGRGMVAPTWCGEEARPLDEDPIIFEFQIELEDSVTHVPEQPKEPLRSFSPDFELHQEHDQRDQHDWPEYRSESNYTSTPPTWELDYPPSEDHFSSTESVSTHLQARHHSSRLYESKFFILFLCSPIYSPAPHQYLSITFTRMPNTRNTRPPVIQAQPHPWSRRSTPIECGHQKRLGLRLAPAMSLLREVPCTRPILPFAT
jgi:hypothetical protein